MAMEEKMAIEDIKAIIEDKHVLISRIRQEISKGWSGRKNWWTVF